MELTKEEFSQGLEGVKRYFDEKTAEMKKYVDEKNAEQTQEMKSYVDEKNTELKNYVDEKIGEVKIYVDEKTQELRDETRKEFTEIHTEIHGIHEDLRLIHTRIDEMKFTLTLSVGSVAVLVGCVIFAPIVASMFGAVKKYFAFQDIDEKINQAVQKAIQENLKKS